ncbi:MAG TPA: MFS transporter [Noviherbaspirillum sp.]|uniref:MFS transporter n=1 Tax=Noviherbaspirillum sp. TaxID=1926288 RepID=UPI002DDD95B8|nr:MFS transporter [Noviherbaspirillum sp.]HEV2609822.1 MFS transporter [Noviherbaspirillum sp.]
MPNAAIAPQQASRLIHVLFVIQLISMGAMEMSGPFWPLHLKALSTSDVQFGIAGVAVYVGPMLGILLTSAFWGRIGDRFGHKPMMIRALLGLSLTQLALAYATDVWTILLLRFLQGACAGYIAPAQAYGVSIEAPLRRARLFAYLQVSTNIGSLAGAVAGGLILDHAAFFWINTVAAILCALCAVAVAMILPSVPPPAHAAPATQPSVAASRSGGSLWRTAPILGLLGIIGILLMSRMITQTPFSLYVGSIFHVSNWVVGLCYGLLALGFVMSASLWARYFENRDLPDALRRMACIAAACAMLTALAGATRNIGVFVAIYFAWGVLLGATTPVLMSLISRAAAGHQQGYVLGIAQGTSQFSSIAGIALGGWFLQAAGLEYIYFLVAFFYALAVVAVLATLRRRQAASRRAGMSPGP